MTRPSAHLALEDGTIFEGVAFGAPGLTTGEVCFNTGMTGYQEVLTDPSYHGQIVTMTAPQIGNTGTNVFDDQSRKPWVAGFVVRDLSHVTSSWRADSDLERYLKGHGVPGIAEIDTRRLTRHLRDRGAMRGALSAEHSPDDLVDAARAAPSMIGLDLAREVTTAEPYEWNVATVEKRAASDYAAGAERSPATAALTTRDPQPRYRIAAYDYGIKYNILDLLVTSGFDVTVVPATTSADWVVENGFDGAFLSNGPGDPEPVTYGIEIVRELLGRVPVFGICLGHQILGLALGARTFKLPFGHRGSNHPVQRIGHTHIEITCQNHGFAVDPASLDATQARLSHVNLNDGTVEGIEVPGVCYSVQYHPESGPGPHDSRYLFTQFRTLIETFEPRDIELSRVKEEISLG
ncbi:MAG TPA: glutamine-hydrolyzing carbamoyl-phosphate synthase small subunit [Actinomycetota bacterium]|nr:glutamine-hydrolyzing carbamoyl-phosphate synthase small subunit [Actinomycetota bacterium]